MTNLVQPGWYDDPSGLAAYRFHDGQGWTRQTRSASEHIAAARAATQTSPAVTVDRAPQDAPARPAVPSGWYPDPAGSDQLRWFDGTAWTEELRDRPHLAASAAPVAPTGADARPEQLVAASATPAPRSALELDSTALRLSRRSLADHARTKQALAPTAAQKGGKHASTLVMLGSMALVGVFLVLGPLSNVQGMLEQREAREQLAASAPVAPAVLAAEEPEVVESEPVEEMPESLAEVEVEAPPEPVFDREANKPALPAEGEPVGTIRSDAIDLDATFVSGTQVPDLKKGPGVWEYGVFPGLPGNATISGHRTTYGGPFRNLDKFEVGDKIVVSVPGQPDAVFEVRGTVIVEPSRVQVTDATDGVRLTLTTCDPVGSDAARLVVQAELVEGAWGDHAAPADTWKIKQ